MLNHPIEELSTGKEKPVHSNIYHLFLEGYKHNPEALAWKDEYEARTYEEALNDIHHLADVLKHRFGIKPGDRIVSYFPNMMHYATLVFACMKIGATLLPLNTRLQENEISYILNDANPCVVLTSVMGEKSAVQATNVCPVVEIEELVENSFSQQKGFEEDFGGKEVEFDHPAFLIYTSGTTGSPKGALLHHGGVIHTVQAYQDFFQSSPASKTLIAVPIFHVTGLIGQLIHMAKVGGTSFIMKRYQTTPYIDLVREEKINFLFNVPTIFQMLIGTFKKYNSPAFPEVKTIAFGGAPMAVDLMREMMHFFPKASLHNCYGATETCSPTTIMPKAYPKEKEGSVGVPIDRTVVKFVTDEGHICKPTEMGELLIKGPMVIKGYWNNAEANQKSFSEGYWHSGDYGYEDEDGYIYIKDRKKDMINRGGENIYSIEVEQALNQLDAVQESAVVGLPHPIYGEVVQAFVVPAKGNIDAKLIKEQVSKNIADYKVPHSIEFLKEIPKNPGGKILKHQLKKKDK
ncbi:class I adenylate-forming enzyme family protein [Salsuginibacillus kocurii]|uniref:class I adenylate-forming enzyme family protein n=1 Tax=Salsuginibacillus kocurii TaxID=427078 RepID=UPI00036B047A|nr:class I adenylate-forming enzyme family protein [Salsuginibacillus kocurii]